MNILGIETSCDDTCMAIVEDGSNIFSNVVASQIPIHWEFGGIVPEVASRKHIELLPRVYKRCLETSGLDVNEIDAVAVSQEPGLIGSLLAGLSFAKGLAYGLNVPLIPVNHILAHVYAVFLEKKDIGFPFISLVVSGGHTELILFKSHTDYRRIGCTRDDACGELLDKIARVMELGYPGGPAIEKAAAKGDETAIKFPRPLQGKSLNFSFSGLKTAVINYLKSGREKINYNDVAASLQKACVDVLVEKTLKAAKKFRVSRVAVCGGVAANKRLREAFSDQGETNSIQVYFPREIFCTDNAAMVASRGYFCRDSRATRDYFSFEASSNNQVL